MAEADSSGAAEAVAAEAEPPRTLLDLPPELLTAVVSWISSSYRLRTAWDEYPRFTSGSARPLSVQASLDLCGVGLACKGLNEAVVGHLHHRSPLIISARVQRWGETHAALLRASHSQIHRCSEEEGRGDEADGWGDHGEAAGYDHVSPDDFCCEDPEWEGRYYVYDGVLEERLCPNSSSLLCLPELGGGSCCLRAAHPLRMGMVRHVRTLLKHVAPPTLISAGLTELWAEKYYRYLGIGVDGWVHRLAGEALMGMWEEPSGMLTSGMGWRPDADDWAHLGFEELQARAQPLVALAYACHTLLHLESLNRRSRLDYDGYEDRAVEYFRQQRNPRWREEEDDEDDEDEWEARVDSVREDSTRVAREPFEHD